MEIASILSYQKQGYEVHLYVYDAVEGIPAGTRVKDAAEILDRKFIFQYKDFASYAGFANLFRYILLFKKGGCWSDLDVFCLRSIGLGEDYYLVEQGRKGRSFIIDQIRNFQFPFLNNCFMKAPAGNSLCQMAMDFCLSQDSTQLTFGTTGPQLLTSLARKLKLRCYVAPVQAICTVPFQRWHDFISDDPGIQTELMDKFSSPGVVAVHLWNEMWRRNNVDKNQTFSANSAYEQLLRSFIAPDGS